MILAIWRWAKKSPVPREPTPNSPMETPDLAKEKRSPGSPSVLRTSCMTALAKDSMYLSGAPGLYSLMRCTSRSMTSRSVAPEERARRVNSSTSMPVW